MPKNSLPNVEAEVPPSGITLGGKPNCDGGGNCGQNRAKKRKLFASRLRSRCRISTSRQNCWTTSPISYTMQETLKSCCLVSKSWIPRTRKHLFTNLLHAEQPTIMEKHVPTPFYLSRALHQNPAHSVPSRRYGRGCGRRWLDSDLRSCCALRG